MSVQKLPYFDSPSTFVSDSGTTVEILTFNMNKNPLALGDVMSSLKKPTDLIVICVQESNQKLTTCRQNICSFLEDYKCMYTVQLGNHVAGFLQMFMLQHKNANENFTFSHNRMPFSFNFRDPTSIRPWKGAIFLKCESQKLRTPFVFVGAHFHAHEGPKNVKLRESDFEQIQTFLQKNYRKCDWCLFGDLNFRSSESLEDEFEPYFKKYNISEYPRFQGVHDANTYKIDVNHRNTFDKHRTPSRTDRICHNKTDNLQILQYGIVKRSGDPNTPAGAGSDHYPVFEVFRILNHTTSLSSPFLISY
jgi:exonuclease III